MGSVDLNPWFVISEFSFFSHESFFLVDFREALRSVTELAIRVDEGFHEVLHCWFAYLGIGCLIIPFGQCFHCRIIVSLQLCSSRIVVSVRITGRWTFVVVFWDIVSLIILDHRCNYRMILSHRDLFNGSDVDLASSVDDRTGYDFDGFLSHPNLDARYSWYLVLCTFSHRQHQLSGDHFSVVLRWIRFDRHWWDCGDGFVEGVDDFPSLE